MKGLNVSLFKELCEKQSIAVQSLCIQYRMNEMILELPNELVYNHSLKCGSQNVAKSCLKYNMQFDFIKQSNLGIVNMFMCVCVCGFSMFFCFVLFCFLFVLYVE